MIDAGPLPDGKHLRLLRRFREKTMEETSAKSFMSLATLFKIETGRITPTPVQVARILGALSTDPPPEPPPR